jgi:N-formylglutamate deformylase
MINPKQFISTSAGSTPLVLDSPHSGTDYPQDFGHVCDLSTLRRAEDTHVEKLYSFAPALGVAWVEAHFPRSYLDANRNITEIDPSMLSGVWPDDLGGELGVEDAAVQSKLRLGKGLIWRMTDDGLPLYDHPLSVAEVQARIVNCWQPYHAAVGSAIDAAHARHGYSIHINCHSMPAVSSSDGFSGLGACRFCDWESRQYHVQRELGALYSGAASAARL